MANTSRGKSSVILNSSVSVDSVDGDLYLFEQPAPLLQNTGVFKQGGLTNLNEIEVLFPDPADHGYTDSGQLIAATEGPDDSLVITADGKSIGTVSALGVAKNLEIVGFDDALLTADDTYMTLKIVSNVVTVTEFDLDGVELDSKSTTFTGIVDLVPLITSIGFVRYQEVHYADSLEFSLRLGDQVVILSESNPGYTPVQILGSTTVLGTSTIRAVAIYNSTLVVAGDDGRVGSFDGFNWRNYDGTGTGTGPFNGGTAMGTNAIYGIAAYGTTLVVAGAGGRVASWDGGGWRNYDGTGSGTGVSDNATLIGSNDIKAVAVWGIYVVFGGNGGRIGAAYGTTKYVYTTAVTDYRPTSNALAVSTNNILAMAVYTLPSGLSTGSQVLVVAATGGLVASFDGGGWINSSGTKAPTAGGVTWTARTSPAPLTGWFSVAYGNGLWVAVAGTISTTQAVMTSPDGVTWTARTNPAAGSGNGWQAIAYGNGLWVAVSPTTSTTQAVMTSPDGVTWTARTNPAAGGFGWNSVAYGNGLWVAVSRTTSTTQAVMTSPDGVTWTARTNPAAAGNGWSSVAYGNGLWVAVSKTTSTTQAVMTSPDGITWTARTNPAAVDNGWNSVAYGNGLWVAVAGTTSTTQAVMTSPDGVTWTARTNPAAGSASGWSSVAYGSGLWVAVSRTTSTTQAVMTSPDGVTWTARTNPAAGGSGWWGVAYGNGIWIAVALTTSTSAAVMTAQASSLGSISNNAGAVGSQDITAVFANSSVIALGSSGGRVGTYNGTSWTNYNAGAGFCSDSVVIGANSINTIAAFGSTIVFSGAGGLVGSWSGAAFKNYDGTGTGTGIYNNATVLGATAITASKEYQSLFWLFGASSANYIDASNVPGILYSDGTTTYGNLLTGMTGTGYLYVYRYENGLYLVDLVANNLNYIWTLDNAAFTVTRLAGQYAWPQVSGGFTRHIITGTPTIVSTDVQAISLTGYTAFNTGFVSGQTFQASGVSVAAIPIGQVGFNYADAVLTPTGAPTQRINFYAPPPVEAPTALQRISQGNTTNLINGYGKLTNNYGVPGIAGFEFRVGWIAAGNLVGRQSYLSAAVLDDQPTDALGTLLTVVGEFNGDYTPVVSPLEDTILYESGGAGGPVFRIIKISTDVPNRIQRLNGRFSKINTISPLNLYDSDTRALLVSSMDYNGRVFWDFTGSPLATSTPVVSLIQYPGDVAFPFSASIDTGERLVTIDSPGVASIHPFGYRIPLSNRIFSGLHVDTYVNGAYSFSTFNNGSTAVIVDPDFPIYAPVPLLPVPIGSRYAEGTATVFGETLFLQPNFDGYQVANSSANNANVSAVGEFVTFLLYGQTYLFDGVQVYLASITNNLLTSITPMTYAQGMRYLATSPTEAYFLSTWDNSVYSYDGGRALTKVKTFTNVDAITTAKYSTYDNALILDTATQFVWFRDGIISVNPKKASQLAEMTYWATANGIYAVNSAGSWRYSYYPEATSTIVPLTVQTAYFGQGKNEITVYLAWVFKFYIPSRTGFSVSVIEHTKDQAKEYANTQVVQVPASDIDSNGYYYLRIQPKYQRGLQQSLELRVTINAILLESDIILNDSVGAIPASSK